MCGQDCSRNNGTSTHTLEDEDQENEIIWYTSTVLAPKQQNGRSMHWKLNCDIMFRIKEYFNDVVCCCMAKERLPQELAFWVFCQRIAEVMLLNKLHTGLHCLADMAALWMAYSRQTEVPWHATLRHYLQAAQSNCCTAAAFSISAREEERIHLVCESAVLPGCLLVADIMHTNTHTHFYVHNNHHHHPDQFCHYCHWHLLIGRGAGSVAVTKPQQGWKVPVSQARTTGKPFAWQFNLLRVFVKKLKHWWCEQI